MIVFSCKEQKQESEPVQAPVVEVYQPAYFDYMVALTNAKTYAYFNAPCDMAAKTVKVSYDAKTPYAEPIVIKYTYSNGDTHTYTISKDFGLWANELGRLRVVIDEYNTVWLQGQTKKGKFHEFVFYGDPKFNGKKIKPNSYTNHPVGVINYVK